MTENSMRSESIVLAALKTLQQLTDKKTCLDIIEENGRHNLTFREYPHSDEWLLKTRESVNAKIKEFCK